MSLEPQKVLRCSTCHREYPADATSCPLHGATLVETDPLLDRIISRRYRLVRCVGRGGMGAVYEGRHMHTDQRVAVKILAPHLSKDLKLVTRFRREAMATSRLRHENCVQVHDFGEDDDGTFFIAMEFVDGRGIGDEIRRSGPMPAGRVARVGAQILGALEAAHGAGILHRDLKPQNIMLTQKVGRPDFVKVVDFGIAKFVENSPEDQAALTLPGTIFGTPEYMSPEQARGEVLDGRSDLYSVAVVLWHMLLGRSPYRGKTVRETLMKVFREEPPRPSEEMPGPDSSRGLEDALLIALAKEPQERFSSAAAFRGALIAFVPEKQRERSSLVMPGVSVDGGAPPETLGMDASPAQPAETTTGPGATMADAHLRQDATRDERRTAVDGIPAKGAPAEDTGANTIAASALPTDTGPVEAVVAEASAQAPVTQPVLAPAGRAQKRRAPAMSLWMVLLLVVGGGAAGGLGLGALAYGITRALKGEPTPAEPPPRVIAEADEGDGGWRALEGFPNGPREGEQKTPDDFLRYAEQALANEDLDAAAAAYREALSGDPSSAAALQGLAMLTFRQGDSASMRRYLEDLMQLGEGYRRQFAGFHSIVVKKLEAAADAEATE